MFFKHIFHNNTVPSVKKASQFVDNSSHKQKKYISLMLVPSYSTGKTRSLRISHALFHSIIIGILIISAVFTGVYLRSNYAMRMAYEREMARLAVEEDFAEFQAYAAQAQNDLIESVSQMYAELSDNAYRADYALSRQARNHLSELEVILEQIETIERIIREFDEDRQTVISGLSSRAAVIPPVAALLVQLEAAQEELKALSRIHTAFDETEQDGVGLLSAGGQAAAETVTYTLLQEYLDILLEELYIQQLLMDSFEHYRARMDNYLRNFPTLWPIRGSITSHFGWRGNPFGGGSREFHHGIDIPARTGTNVRATGGGVVSFSGWRSGFGYTVMINHGGGITTLYAHNSRNLVTVGQRVDRGDVIALVGSTGRSTAPHVHYEVHVNGTPVNPVPFMREHF